MTDAQVKDLYKCLMRANFSELEPFPSNFPATYGSEIQQVYAIIANQACLGKASYLRKEIKDMDDCQGHWSPFDYVSFGEVHDILFGDINLVPSLIHSYPLICKWHLSLEE